MSIFDDIQNFINGLNGGEYRYNEDLMETMIQRLESMIAILDESKITVANNADKIRDNEYLVGETADTLHEAMSGTLNKAIGEIRDEAQEQLNDIRTELEQFREVVRKYKELIN